MKDNGSFESFVNEKLQNQASFEDMTVSYTTGNREFNVKYGVHFNINGETIDTNYARYENDYVSAKVERKSDIISLNFEGKSLTLDYKNGTREE